jgi:hypothetical protein
VETLVTGRPIPTALAVDDEAVYWQDAAGLWRQALHHGKPVNLSSETAPRALGVPLGFSLLESGGSLYYATDAGVARVPRQGGPRQLVTSGTSVPLWADPVQDDLYAATGPNGGAMVRLPLAGGAGETVRDGTVVGIAGDAKALYFADRATQTIGRIDRATGTSTTLAGGTGPSTALLAFCGNLVCTYSEGSLHNDGAILCVSKRGGPLRTLATGLGFGFTMVGDSSGLYFDDVVTASLYRAQPDGTLDVLVRAQTPELALDDKYVYWTDTVQGAILRIAK